MRRIMYSSISFVFSSLLVFAGCSAGDSNIDPDPNRNPDPSEYLAVSGTIAENVTWSGNVRLVDSAIIAPGVTVTVAPGTAFLGAKDAGIRVEGTLEVAGTAAEPVTMNPVAGAPSWNGITVEAGGTLNMAYASGANVATLVSCKAGAVGCTLSSLNFSDSGYYLLTEAPSRIEKSTLIDMANGGITARNGSDLTIVDSVIFTSSGDLIVTQPGSRVTVEYSEIGGAQGSYEHCNFHIGGAEYLSITNSNLVAGVFAMMLGGTTNAVIQYNNFIDNGTDISEVGANTGADLRYNYWDKGAPNLGGNYDTSSAVQSAYEQAGPRL